MPHQSTKAMRTTLNMEHFWIELTNNKILTKPINIMRYIAQITAPLHHHPPHNALQDQINQGNYLAK